MKIIIIGNGKVGYTLAKQLAGEAHALVLVDESVEALKEADTSLDVLCMEGNGASIRTLKEAGVRSADLVIAVTGYDEVNIICCLIAKKLGAKHTVARIRNPEYYNEAPLLKQEIGLDMVINPEYAAAQEISRILRVPSAFSVETFARGRVDMIGFYVTETDGLAGVPLYQYNKKNPNGVLICAAIRGSEVFVPNGRFVPQIGDKVYIIGSHRELNKFLRLLGRPANPVRTLSVLGGSRIATYLGWAAERMGMKMKLVELNREKCLDLTDKLPSALIIHGDGTDHNLLEAEEILSADAFVSLTNRDEENLLMALSAQRSGVKKVIAKMSRPNYIELMRESGVDSIISPKDITANQISAYARSLANSEGSAVEHLYKLLGGAMEAVMFTANAATHFLNTPLKDLRFKEGLLVAAIVRNNQTIIPDGNSEILDGDKVIVMAKSLFLQDLNEILQ
ncbi:MAG: Trk system potassium transporter TrkA [Oscillospiraceae bacterium]|jgi:trk system potassium uptake protein TrkA|nr:Trk system potassium transporter TrkA [Oscillospiraceae bacterium]MCI9588556.1 Trk system potassium transporter TrkA [Oscillospiraceae bacterium]